MIYKQTMDKQNLKLSIIIPCYNEENNLINGVLSQVSEYLTKQTFTWEVLLCNDASTDNSLNYLHEFAKINKGFKVIDLPHGGKPSALFGGLKKAKYDWSLFTDMDQSTPMSQLDQLIPYFSHFDVVIGSRGRQREGNSIIRKIGSFLFLLARRTILLSGIVDTQCGFKAIKTDLALKIFPELAAIQTASVSSGWRVSSYDVEMLHLAEIMKKKIKEVPVTWKNEDISTTKGGFSARYKKESQQMIKEIIRVKLNDLKGVYTHH